MMAPTVAVIMEPIMPPAKNKSNAVNLTPDELALLKLWIDQGAKGTANIAPPAPKNWLRSDHEPIYTVAVSPDGRYAACGRGHNVHVYDLTQQLLVAELIDSPLEPRYFRGLYPTFPVPATRAGGKPLDADAFLRGHALAEGTRLGP